MSRRDAGLSHDYWKRYYTLEEVEEILDASQTTTIVSGNLPLNVRIYERSRSAPTVLQSHGLITYGLCLARLQLPFYRAGFNVIQFDMPGWGQSGGPRGGCTIEQSIQAWRDAFEWATRELDGPFYTLGFGEDGTTCYYALANHPRVSAMSFHNLWDYSDPDVMQWQGPTWLVRAKCAVLSVARFVLPTRTVGMQKGVPWDDLFGPRGQSPYRDIFLGDPLRNAGWQYPLAYSMMKRHRPRVPFEACRTPIQLIASELNRLWPYDMNLRSYTRLGGEKELVTLEGQPHWVFTREFDETFCAHALDWYARHGADSHIRARAATSTP